MKKLIVAAAVLATFAAPQAFAQAKNFEGASAALSVNFAKTKTELSNSSSSLDASDTDQNAALQLQYGVALNEKFVLGLGATINIGDAKSGNLTVGNTAYQTKQKDTSSLYVAPGYAVTDSILAYGKLAYLSSKLSDGDGGSQTFNGGFGFGVGAQYLLNKNMFVQAEYISNKYDDQKIGTATLKLNSDVFSVGVGYKF